MTFTQDLAALRAQQAVGQSWLKATVTNIEPLRVRPDTNISELQQNPVALCRPAVGDRVLCLLNGSQLIVTGIIDEKRPYWRAYANGSQAKTTGVLANVSWTLDRQKDGGTITNAAIGLSSYREIIKTGIYALRGRVTWASATTPTGTRSADLRLNPAGSDWSGAEATLDRAQDAPSSTGLTGLTCEWEGPLEAGDIVGLTGLHTQGSDLNVIGTIHQTWFEIEYLRGW